MDKVFDSITEERLKYNHENERGAHSEKNARCGHTRENKKRVAKPKMERRMQERHDRGGAERGQHDKQGSMEEYDKNMINSYTGDKGRRRRSLRK